MSSRRMIYPYTIGAKVAQFPYKFYWNKSWLYKYGIIGLILATPLFFKIEKLSYSPVNVERFEKLKQKDLEEIKMHKLHLK